LPALGAWPVSLPDRRPAEAGADARPAGPFNGRGWALALARGARYPSAIEGVERGGVMEILGHSRIAVTLEIYTGADDASRREAIERLNRLFEGRSA
jgi:hypothetical protein